MTLTELTIEHEYRLLERLGILCGDGYADRAAQDLARQEADAWLEGAIKDFSFDAGAEVPGAVHSNQV